jgi:hypothetical protein
MLSCQGLKDISSIGRALVGTMGAMRKQLWSRSLEKDALRRP